MRKLLALVVKAVIFWACCSVCLWWAYSMSATIQGGFYTFRQALLLVLEMSGLTTVLVSVVWIISPLLHQRQTWIGFAVKTALEAALILALYTAAVFFWRQNWTPGKGMSESAAFMPIVGHINSAFFSEFLWLEYLICVIPLMAVLAGLLASSFDSLQKKKQAER